MSNRLFSFLALERVFCSARFQFFFLLTYVCDFYFWRPSTLRSSMKRPFQKTHKNYPGLDGTQWKPTSSFLWRTDRHSSPPWLQCLILLQRITLTQNTQDIFYYLCAPRRVSQYCDPLETPQGLVCYIVDTLYIDKQFSPLFMVV